MLAGAEQGRIHRRRPGYIPYLVVREALQRTPWGSEFVTPRCQQTVRLLKTIHKFLNMFTKDCVLLCWFHHQVVIHRWGWTLVLNPDGTTTAWNKDRTKVLHSHGPPPRPG